jgi:AcrR family transcriptional regulator
LSSERASPYLLESISLSAGVTLPTAPRKRPAKTRRAEKSLANRRALLRAAAELIAEHGYEGAIVARVAERAGLGAGTFYIYFETRQHMLDVLLPELTDEMLGRIAGKLHGSRDYLDMEERAFRAFVRVIDQTPGLFRIINEAQVAAPTAYTEHIERTISSYVASLERGHREGFVKGVVPAQFRELAYMLIGARNNLYVAYVNSGRKRKTLASIIDVYIRLVRKVIIEP